jgi:pyruvate,orthophosphate dikinase
MARPRTSLKSKSKSRPKSAKRARTRQAFLARKPQTRVSGNKTTKKSTAGKSARWVYPFGGGKAAGKAGMRNLLGGKGAGLAEMASLGLPVPPGFTITTEVCTYYYANNNSYPGALEAQRSPRSAASPAKCSATSRTRCSSRCVPARAPRCRA